VDAEVGQSIWGGQLRWRESRHCFACGCATETDNHGLPPLKVRHAMLKEDGQWSLRVIDSPASKSRLAQVVSQALNVSPAAVARLLKKIPAEIATGTSIEMHWLGQLLKRECGASVQLTWKG
jgi:hypothetical protein